MANVSTLVLTPTRLASSLSIITLTLTQASVSCGALCVETMYEALYGALYVKHEAAAIRAGGVREAERGEADRDSASDADG